MFTLCEGDLDDEQKQAVLEPGSVFIEACPGSGKTRTLTYKIAYELTRLKSRRQFVVAITYTNRAADEIRERIEILGVDTSQLWIGTVHSFCLNWILRPYGRYHATLRQGFSVVDSYEREQLLQELCQGKGVSHWDCDFYFSDVGYRIACQEPWKKEGVKTVVHEYLTHLRENGLVDFELILCYAFQLIRDQPMIPKLLAQLIPFILIDEFQDTKKIQYLIVSAILRASNGATAIFMVGDPNQAIFTSLGGYAINFDEFRDMAHVKMTKLRLGKNYRSSKRIIDFFKPFSLTQSPIEAASDGCDYRSRITLNRTITESELAAGIEALIRFNLDSIGVSADEICVLGPQWAQIASITRQLSANMPDMKFDGPGMVPFSRDRENFWYKVARLALTEASPQMYGRRIRWASEILNDLEGQGLDVSGLSSRVLLKECNAIDIQEPEGLLFLKQFFQCLFVNLGIKVDLSDQLDRQQKSFFESSNSRVTRMEKEAGGVIRDTATFKRVFGVRDGVTVSTIHGIKGAEFDAVIAFGLLEDFVPHFSDQQKQISGKKLLYVVASRAMKNLHLIAECERYRRNDGREYQLTQVLENHQFDYDGHDLGKHSA